MIVLDFKNERCPIPLVHTKLHIKQAAIGDSFVLILSDPGSVQDVPKFIKKIGHQLSLIEQTSDNVYKYQVKIT